MSSSTIRTTIRPGDRIQAALAERRQRMLADRGTLAEQYGSDDADSLDSLRARLDATAPVASVRELAKARAVLDRVAEADSREEARAAVDELEAASERRWADRTERELLLEELAERTGVRIREGTREMQADGRLTVSLEVPGKGVSPVTISGSHAAGDESGSSFLWEVSASDIQGDGTQEGACKAQREMVEGIVESYGEGMSLSEEREEVEPQTRPHHVNRRA